MTNLSEKLRRIWIERLHSVRKDRQREIITDAKELGQLTFPEIATEVGLSVPRVKAIVAEVKAEREQA